MLLNARSRLVSISTLQNLTAMPPDAYDVERYGDGTILVRVHSCDRNGRKLPDAVFTFRLGDPQYTYWAARAVPASRHAASLTI